MSGKNFLLYSEAYLEPRYLWRYIILWNPVEQVKANNYISQKSSIVDVRLDYNHQVSPLFHNSGILIYPRTMNVLCLSFISLLST